MSRFVAALLVLATLPGCDVRRTPAEAGDPLDGIDVAMIERHVSWLADDDRQGRLAGTPGYDAAAEYVARQFARIGLQPAGEGGYRQPVPLRRYRIADNAPTMAIHAGDETYWLTYRDEFSIRPDPLRAETRVRAPVVFVGYGIHAPGSGYSDYDGVDVSGKIVAYFAGAPEQIGEPLRTLQAAATSKRRLAAARGAVGTIALMRGADEERSPWSERKQRINARPLTTWATEVAAGGFNAALGANAALSPAAAERLFSRAPSGFREVQRTLEDGVEAFELGVEVTLGVRSTFEDVASANVVGLMPGTDPAASSEIVVYTAHLDHVGMRDGHGRVETKTGKRSDALYNGAYDNAMGVGLMLEVARALAATPPRRPVLFVAVTAEEQGLIGSDYFVHASHHDIVANVNIDLPLFLFPLADLVPYGAQHSSLQPVVAAAASAEGFTLADDPFPELGLLARSDHYPFLKGGIPAVFLVSGTTSLDASIDGAAAFRDFLQQHYHKPSDDGRLPVDRDSVYRYARMATRIGLELGNADARPAWTVGDRVAEHFAGAANTGPDTLLPAGKQGVR